MTSGLLIVVLGGALATAQSPRPNVSVERSAELSRDALLGQILPKLKRTVRDPYSIRDLTLCGPRGVKLLNGRPDRWSVFFSFNVKNAYGGYVGVETWAAIFRKGRLSGELYQTQLSATQGLMGLLNKPLQREIEACLPVPDNQLQKLLGNSAVAQ